VSLLTQLEATAGASPVPSGAGTGSAQSDSPLSKATASNSAGQTSSQPQRQKGAGDASPSSDIDNRDQREARQQAGRDDSGKFTSHQKQEAKQAEPVDDDPEFDFGERGKAKRSQVLATLERMRASQAAEAKRAAETQKRYDSMIAGLKKFGVSEEEYQQDPEAALQKAAHARLARQIEEAQMDPRELEMKRREETLQEREARIQAEEQARQQQQHETAVAAKADEFASSIHEALERSSLPRNPETVARMASYMLAAARKGAQIPKEQLAALVAKRIGDERGFHVSALKGNPEALVGEVSQYLSGVKLDGPQIAKLIGQENTEALRKHLLSEAQSKFNPKPQTPRPAQPKVIESKDHPNGYITWDQMQALSKQRGI
jgi:hypothetical protein